MVCTLPYQAERTDFQRAGKGNPAPHLRDDTTLYAQRGFVWEAGTELNFRLHSYPSLAPCPHQALLGITLLSMMATLIANLQILPCKINLLRLLSSYIWQLIQLVLHSGPSGFQEIHRLTVRKL